MFFISVKNLRTAIGRGNGDNKVSYKLSDVFMLCDCHCGWLRSVFSFKTVCIPAEIISRKWRRILIHCCNGIYWAILKNAFTSILRRESTKAQISTIDIEAILNAPFLVAACKFKGRKFLLHCYFIDLCHAFLSKKISDFYRHAGGVYKSQTCL